MMKFYSLIFVFSLLFSLFADPYAIRRIPGEKRSGNSQKDNPFENTGNKTDQESSDDPFADTGKTEAPELRQIRFRLPKGVTITLVRIPAGSFIFSAADGQNWRRENEVHVTLKNDFYLGMFEVTQAQYMAVIGMNPSHRKKGLDLPVENISWNDAMFFCDRMTKYLAPPGWKFTLPTECQWEYAARAGVSSSGLAKVQRKTRIRSTRNGYTFSGSDNLDEVGWYDGNSGNHTHPVGQKKPNDFGLYDMSGNVWEWCLDNWTNDSKKVVPEFYRGNDKDYREPRMMRGGGYRNVDKLCRVAFRQYKEASFRYRSMGFRLALVPLPGNKNPDPVGNIKEDQDDE